MIELLKRYQNIIGIVVILVVGFVVYSYFFTGNEEPLLMQEVGQEASADQDLIALLLELRSITLDETIFSNPSFTSLQDFSKELVPEPVGRVNPFAPLGAAEGQ